MFELLQAAYDYSNEPDYRVLVTQRVLQTGFLPPDIRVDAGEPQIWRDYQQVLAELGLIVSTRFSERVVVTPIGLMWLDGSIGHAEVVTTQCLRYQYPNGHKQDISPALRAELEANNMAVPDTRTELDAGFGVMMKPAVLVLRILLELLERGDVSGISDRECLGALVPVRTNREWPLALGELFNIRQDPRRPADVRRLRHVQEWFRLLDLSDIFQKSGPTLALTPVGIQNVGFLRELCVYHEDPGTFWMPAGDKRQMGLSWFDHFGNPDILSQWLVPEEVMSDLEYINTNYPHGIEEPEGWVELEAVAEWTSGIDLQPFAPSSRATRPEGLPWLTRDDAERILRGRVHQRRRSLLHEDLVALVAGRLHEHGYAPKQDPQSVDLLVSRAGEEAIVEVKTVSKRNLRNQMRLGVGQLSEYRYRRQLDTGSTPTGVLVISSRHRFPDWLIQYLETDVHLGLASRTASDKFLAHTSGELVQLLAS